MKNLYVALTLLISGSVFGQIEQDVNKNTGTESNPINEIDSIRFDPGQTQMEVILNNGSAIIHTIEDIDNVTFSGEILGVIEGLDCSGATINGTLVEGIVASSISAEIDYTGGNGGPHNGQTVNSTGVTGLTAELPAGNFSVGLGTLTYDITGTPNSDGTASFAIEIGGETCTLEITVESGGITSLNCSGATINGTLVEGIVASSVSAEIDYTGGNGGPHNGQTVNSTGVTGLTAELPAGNFSVGLGTLTYEITGTPNSNGTASFAIEIGGEMCTLEITVESGGITSLNCSGATINGTLLEGIVASGVSAEIDYTGGNGGPHNGQTVNSTGVTGLTAELPAGNFSVGAGTLTYDITGTPNSNGTASFAIQIGGMSCTLEVTVDADPYPPGTIHCGDPTAIVDVTNPTTGETWMDRNLGASQVATSITDQDSYGDLYQWGRRSDGHQCRNSATTSTNSSIDQPGHGNFILEPSFPYDWRSPQNTNLWQGVNGVNNPCPSTYRLPTEAELNAERLSWSQNNSAGAFASPLKLPMAGYRFGSNGSLFNVGTFGYYWSSTVSSTNSRNLYFNSSNANMDTIYRANGTSVRCIKD